MRSGELSQAGERSRRQFCFAEFTLDLDGGFLRRGDKEVTLSPKAFDLLAYLVEQHGRVVTKADLIEHVWADTAVTDNSLAQRLLEIRRALADDSQQLIRTVARRGYVFAAPVTTPVVEFPLDRPALIRKLKMQSMNELTKEYLDEKLAEQTRELKGYVDQQGESLARTVNTAFETHQREYLEPRLSRLHHSIEGLELKVSASASSWSQDFERLHEWVLDIEERLTALEHSKAKK